MVTDICSRYIGSAMLDYCVNEYDEEYDVVIDTLQKQRDRLWNMTQSNMNHDMFNIMDEIRLEQIDELEKAMAMWKKSKE
jgi:hypothetical protein